MKSNALYDFQYELSYNKFEECPNKSRIFLIYNLDLGLKIFCEVTLSVTLFDSDPQYREKATIWRIFSLLPLFGPLAKGRIWRWFAVNMPMDLGTGGRFTSDIDIMACVRDFPQSNKLLYETWEVKVSLLCRDGSARSLKSGKIARMMNQLKAYKEFGSPCVSLLDIYICEAGFMSRNPFPPPSLDNALEAKRYELSRDGFGYQLLPFEHGKDGNIDVGLKAYSKKRVPLETNFKMLAARESLPREPFLRLANRINHFFERAPDYPKKPFNQIVFCRDCRGLQLIRMRDMHTCPNCKKDLIIQS